MVVVVMGEGEVADLHAERHAALSAHPPRKPYSEPDNSQQVSET